MLPKISPFGLRVGAFITLFLALGVFFVLTRSRGQTRSFGTLPLGGKQYEVVLSRTSEETTLGLSYRKNIGAEGMLFVFSQRSIPTFWMLEMRFPLDFIWIDENTVVSLHENVPAPGLNSQQSEIARVRPTQPVTAVLEVPAGFIERESIKIGTQVGEVTEIRTKMW